jgi:hypothetical protein
MSDSPIGTISIVIASAAGGAFLFRCLESLRLQAAASDVETIVIDRIGEGRCREIEARFPFARALHVSGQPTPSVPRLRALGVREARGSIVAILEEHCAAPPGWVGAICQTFEDGDVTAAGGPISHDDFLRLRDWVVYLCEYHNYLPHWPDGERASLNGANIAYRKEALDRHRDALPEGYWEVVLNPLLQEEGGSFWAVQAMEVRHTGPFDYGYYLRQRYLLSRAWGGTHRDQVGTGRRLAYLVGAPIFPMLLLARIGAKVASSDVPFGIFFRALPALVPAAAAYVWGEWLGYLLGPADALEKVE